MNPPKSEQNLVSEWLSTYPSKYTVANHRSALKQFFFSVFGESSLDRLDQQALEYFSQDRNYTSDITEFVKSLSHYAPLTAKLKIGTVRLLFSEQGIEFKKVFWKKINRQVKGNKAITLDRTPSKKELRQILSHMRVKGKALFLTLASSGMRIGETLQLKLEDVELTEDLVRIYLRGDYTKSGNSRRTFASREALEAIREWLKVRDDYLKRAVARSHRFKKNLDDPRLFPYTKDVAYFMWNEALDKAELNDTDKATGRRKLHAHSLRKFFRTKMASLIQVDIVEALMGHAGYLTDVYRKYSEKDLEKFYLQAESTVLIFTEAEQVTRLRKEVEESKEQLQVLVNGLTAENLELKSRISKVELEKTELTKRIQQAEEKLEQIERRLSREI